MSTTLLKPETVERKWYVIDAAGKPLGRVAVVAANLLRGKNKVVIINCDKAVLTGKKLEQKFYHHHTGWIGGLKSVNYKTLMATKSDKAMELAVKGMLPNNKLGDKALTRLRTYKGAAHNNRAQKPETVEL